MFLLLLLKVLAKLFDRIALLCEAYDDAVKSDEDIAKAQSEMQDLLSSDSFETMDKKLDTLAKSQVSCYDKLL